MATSTSMSSTSLYGSSANKGFGGLASGLDTDDLVKQMTARTRNKINRQYQSKQKLLYKQEAYRSVSSKLLEFSNKYFSSSAASNVLNSSFFKANTFDSSSQYVSVSGNVDNIKNFSITNITSVATAASFTSNNIVSKHTFESSEITDYISTLAGETMSIEFGGKAYSLSIDNDFGKGADDVTIDEMVIQLNKQLATITGNESNQLLKYKLDATGKQVVFETGTAKLIGASTKILDTLNLKTGQEAVSTADITKTLTATKESILTSETAYMTFDFNGVQKKINLNSSITDAENLKNHLQVELDKAYGTGKVNVGYDNITKKISFTANGDNNLFGISSISKELRYLTGIEPTTYNRINTTKAISETNLATSPISGTLSNGKEGYSLSVNGKVFEFEKTATLSDIMKTINSDVDAGVNIYYSSTTDTYTVRSTQTGENQKVDIKDLNGTTLAQSLFGTAGIDYNIKAGTDTIMSYMLNGVKTDITRSTANFSIDGININLNEKAVGVASVGTPVTFTVTSNTNEVVDRVKQFITDYNELISLMNTKTSEKPNKDYQPLTPEQSDDMEKNEIENWTKEAKKGILFGDSKINNVLNSFRSAMSLKTSVSSITLSDMGISAANMDTTGKLTFDEEKFKSKLAGNLDEIIDLFTGTSTDKDAISGISSQIQAILKKNIGSYGLSGILVEEAGMDNSITSDRNSISEYIKDYDDKLSNLKNALQKERERYWNKFTALEKTISKLNTQSSWFMGNMGS